MIVKGIELMQMIADGKIKDGTIFSVYSTKYIYSDGCFWEYSDKYGKTNEEMGVSVILSNGLFEILEDKTDEIEEYKTTYTERCIDKEVREKLNEVIRAVNKIKKTFTIDTSKDENCMSD